MQLLFRDSIQLWSEPRAHKQSPSGIEEEAVMRAEVSAVLRALKEERWITPCEISL